MKFSNLYCLWIFSNSLVSSNNCFLIESNSVLRVFSSSSNLAFSSWALASFSLFWSNWILSILIFSKSVFALFNSSSVAFTSDSSSLIFVFSLLISSSVSFCKAFAWSNTLTLSSTSFWAASKSAANLVIFSIYLTLSNSSWSTTFCCSFALVVKLLILTSISCTLAVAFSVCFSVDLSSSNTLVALSTLALASTTGCSLLSRTFTASSYAFLKLSRSGTAGNSTVSFDSLLYLAL